MQESHPDAEDLGNDLPIVVEAAEDEAFLRQPGFATRWRSFGDIFFAVIDLIAIRQVDDLFRIEPLLFERRHHLVGDDIVDEIGTYGTGKAEIVCLDRRGTIGKNAGPRILRVSL